MKTFILLFTFILVNSTHAQLAISFSAGIDPKEIPLYDRTASDRENAYWNKGFSFGTNIDYSISENIVLTLLFHYSHYSFHKYTNTGFSIPEIRFLYAEGKNSKLWRTLVEGKYFPYLQNRFKFFILSVATKRSNFTKNFRN